MSDDFDSTLPSDIKLLLRSERAFSEMPGGARASLALRLSAPLGATGAHAPKSLGGLRALAVKGVAIVAMGGALVGMHHAAKTRETAPLEVFAPPKASRPSTPITPTAEDRASVQAAPIVTQAPPPEVTRRAPRAVPMDDETRSNAEEHRILDQAREAVVRGEPERALDLAAQHAARFPHGTLAEERYAIRIRALARLGRKTEAEQALTEMRARYPRSFLLEGATQEVGASTASETIP